MLKNGSVRGVPLKVTQRASEMSSKTHENRAELTTSWQARPALLARFHGTLDCELPVSPIEVLPGLLGRALEGIGIEECFFLSTIFF